MTDPLSIAASITTLIELTTRLVKYINNTVNASENKRKLSAELSNTTAILSMLQDLIQHHAFREDLYPVAGTLHALAENVS
jgi:hypothetical protein